MLNKKIFQEDIYNTFCFYPTAVKNEKNSRACDIDPVDDFAVNMMYVKS